MHSRSRIGAVLSLALLGSATALAQVQTIAPAPSSQAAGSGAPIGIEAVYTATAPTTGICIRIHFDSSELSFSGEADLYTTDFIAQQAPQSDDANLDGDTATDSFVQYAWASLGGTFTAGPQTLLTANFLTAGAFAGTSVRFSSCGSAAGFAFASAPATITVGAPPPSILSVACPAGLISGGSAGTATITLSGAAPAGGATIATSSSATGVATVAGSATVAAGATTGTFAVTPVAAGTSTITVTYGASVQTCIVSIAAAPAPAAVSITGCPSSALTAGDVATTLTVNLASAAPAGGTVVSLASDDTTVATVAGSVTVPAGSTAATFGVDPVGGGTATISATSGGATVTCVVNVVSAPASGIPALDEWAMIAMAALLLAAGIALAGRVRF